MPSFALSSNAHIDQSEIILTNVDIIRACKTRNHVDNSHVTNNVGVIRKLVTESEIDRSHITSEVDLIRAANSTTPVDNSEIRWTPNFIRAFKNITYIDTSSFDADINFIQYHSSDSYLDQSNVDLDTISMIRYVHSTEYIDRSYFNAVISRAWLSPQPECDLTVVSHGGAKRLANHVFDADNLYGINIQLRDPRLSRTGTKVEFYCRTSPYGKNEVEKSTATGSIVIMSLNVIPNTTIKEMNLQVSLSKDDFSMLPKKNRMPIYYTLMLDNGLQEVFMLEKDVFFINNYR